MLRLLLVEDHVASWIGDSGIEFDGGTSSTGKRTYTDGSSTSA